MLVLVLVLAGVVVTPAYGSWNGHAKTAAENYVDNYHPAWADRWSVACHSGGRHVATCVATFPRGAAVGCTYHLKVTGSRCHVRRTSATC